MVPRRGREAHPVKKRERKRERGENGLGYFCFFFFLLPPLEGDSEREGWGGPKKLSFFIFVNGTRVLFCFRMCVCV